MSGIPGIHLPLYTTPEFSLTTTGLPMISLRKLEGSLPSPWLTAPPFSMVCLSLIGLWMSQSEGVGLRYVLAPMRAVDTEAMSVGAYELYEEGWR